jgi:4-methylaminobutanoate oxidase (formaldehyde-forming)
MVTRLRTTAAMAEIHTHSAELYARLEAETGVATGWKQVGSLFLARTEDRVTQNRRAAAMARQFGVDSHEISREEVAAIWPMMRTDDLAGAVLIPGDGRTEPASTARALAEGARKHGVSVQEGVRVSRLRHQGTRVTGVETTLGPIEAETVLLCGGMWTRQLGLDHGFAVPAYPVEHHYAVTDPVDGVTDWMPCTRDHDGQLYIRSEGQQLVLGAFQPNARPWTVDRVPDDFSFDLLNEDWEGFETAMREANHRIPGFDRIGFDRFVNGPESFTPDSHTIVGPVVGWDGLYVCAGFNSFGIAGAGGMGKVVAEWVATGEEPMDLWEVDSRRFAPWQNDLPYLTERVSEVLGHHYQLAYPTNEFHSARDQRRTPVHDGYAAAGAVFGERLGWERPLLIDPAVADGHLTGTFGKADWFAAWAAEHRAAREAVALFDQSSFARLDISGPDALRLLNWACANDVDQPEGRVVYTPMLNRHGRYVSDLTIARSGDGRFQVMTAAIQAVHDRDWLERLAREHSWRVAIEDVTADSAVLGLMGPRARDLLARIVDGSLPEGIGEFGSAHEVSIDGVRVRAVRISYVGESGWELHVDADRAGDVFDAITAVGNEFGLRLAGTMAMNSLRLEKGYVSWSHDVSRDDTPLEAGYGFTVAWNKPGGFLGQEALVALRQAGSRRRLVWFRLDDPEPVLWGHEPIYREGVYVGFTTSGSYGHTAGTSVALGYVNNDGPISRGWVEAGIYEIEVAGRRYMADAHWRSPL